MQTTMERTAPDFAAIKVKQNAAWASGDYAAIGVTLQIVGEQLAEALDLSPTASVLDVAAGNGNATLAFARRGHLVTSTDYVPSLLERGAARAQAEATRVEFLTADAEALPFEDGSFDAVVSTFGVMFAPNQEQAAAELMRVCRSGGRIGLANWTPGGFIGELFKVIGRHVPPPAGLSSPARWGDEAWLSSVFGAGARTISVAERRFVFRYPSAADFVDIFQRLYGPVHKAFLAVGPAGETALRDDILALVERFDTREAFMRVPSTYSEVIIDKA